MPDPLQLYLLAQNNFAGEMVPSQAKNPSNTREQDVKGEKTEKREKDEIVGSTGGNGKDR